MNKGTVIACTHCGQEYIVKTLPLGPYVCSKPACKSAESKRMGQNPKITGLRNPVKTHTPGPWQATIRRAPNGDLFSDPYIFAPNGDDAHRHVCLLYDNGQLDANAALIAAAPELLDVVNSLESWLSQEWRAVEKISPGVRGLLDNAQEAIAKAKGGV